MMNRREHLKLLLATPLGAALLSTPVSAQEQSESRRILAEAGLEHAKGFTPEELKRDQALKEKTFFNDHERQTVDLLSDMIIPADDRSDGATDAGVPEFIDFIMNDQPQFQLPMRGGLMWLDQQCRARFGEAFVACDESQRRQILDAIAYSQDAEPEMAYGVRFFSRLRGLVITGFFTSEIGLQDLDYRGNTSTFWDGVPEQVLQAHGMSYDQRTLDVSIRADERGKVAEWDDQGNLIR